MKYTDLSDKDRYNVIKAGVKAGYTSLDDIEKYYNEFANGGHIFNGEEFSKMTDQDVYLQRLKQQQQQKLNLNPNFTNQMWNSKQGLNERLNSKDFIVQQEALKEQERQRQFDESKNKNEVARLKMLAKDGTIKNKELLSVINNPNSSNDDIINAYNKSLKNYVDYSKYDSGIAKIAAAWGMNPEKLEALDMSASLGEATPGLTGKFIAAGNIGGNIGAAIMHPGQGHLKDAASSAIYMLPGAGVIKSTKMARAGNPMTWKNLFGIGRGIYGLADVTKGVADAFEEKNIPGNIASNKMDEIYNNKYAYLQKNYPEYFDEEGNVKEDAWYNIQQIDPDFYNYINNDSADKYITTNDDGTQTYNPYQQMVNANIADRSRKIQTEQAAKAATQTTKTPTSTPTQTTDTKVRVPVPASMQTPKQQITQQPLQQQVTRQKPTKMQGFMNKLGSAAPYIGDFVGWTLGNSKFFKYGGNIYETKDLH